MGAAEAGNYKGVMLCNRPMEQASRPGPQMTAAPEPPSFRPVGLPADDADLHPARGEALRDGEPEARAVRDADHLGRARVVARDEDVEAPAARSRGRGEVYRVPR